MVSLNLLSETGRFKHKPDKEEREAKTQRVEPERRKAAGAGIVLPSTSASVLAEIPYTGWSENALRQIHKVYAREFVRTHVSEKHTCGSEKCHNLKEQTATLELML